MSKEHFVYRQVSVEPTLDATLAKCRKTYGERIRELRDLEDFDLRTKLEKDFEVERFLDGMEEEYLPKELRGLGYSRLDSMYAWPFKCLETQLYPNVDKSGITVMQLRLEDTNAIVTPMSLISRLYCYDYSQKVGELVEEARWMRGLIEEYWSSAVTLGEFMIGYRETEPYIFEREDGHKIDVPEVLIPSRDLSRVSIVGINGS
jgi:hypothetical protein